MKMKLQYYLWVVLLLVLQGCETAMPEYNDPECGLRFPGASKELGYTFLYDEPGTREAQVNITIQSIGMVKDYDRPVRIKQVNVGLDTVNAEAGVHYQPIDESLCYIPAGKAVCVVPLTVLYDPSLDDKEVILRLELVENEHFKINMRDSSRRDIKITNFPIWPSNWMDEWYGTYGPEKHRFLIRISGEKWDEEFLDILAGNYAMRRFWGEKARKDLNEENKRREEAGEKPLSENDEEKNLVAFPKWW